MYIKNDKGNVMAVKQIRTCDFCKEVMPNKFDTFVVPNINKPSERIQIRFVARILKIGTGKPLDMCSKCLREAIEEHRCNE